MRAVHLAAYFLDHGSLPDAGGVMDQAAVFEDVVAIVAPVRAAAQQRHIDRANKDNG